MPITSCRPGDRQIDAAARAPAPSGISTQRPFPRGSAAVRCAHGKCQYPKPLVDPEKLEGVMNEAWSPSRILIRRPISATVPRNLVSTFAVTACTSVFQAALSGKRAP